MWASSIITPRPHYAEEICSKVHQMFSVHTTPGNLKTQQPPIILDLCLRKTWAGNSHIYCDVIVFEKLRLQNVFRSQENEKPAFSNSSGLKSVFDKLCFGDGLVWTAVLTVEIKLRFKISPAWCGLCLVICVRCGRAVIFCHDECMP